MQYIKKAKTDWFNLSFLAITPIIGLILMPYFLIEYGFNTFDWLCFAFMMIATGLGITGGYHRLWSHKSYKVKSPLKWFYLIFGTCAIQNSVIKWCSDHRRHHQFTDTKEKDPYSASEGFWYSHIAWIYKKHFTEDLSNVNDLKKDKVLMHQHKYYLLWTVFWNIGICSIMGIISVKFFDGYFIAPFLLAGFFRIFLNHHFTFFINSLAHIWGKQPYSDKDSAKDNFFLAFVTYGEGYHNFHHTFQADYRNGIRWYHWDPTKWLIDFSALFNISYDLKKVSDIRILEAKLNMAYQKSKLKLTNKTSEQESLSKLEQIYNDALQALEDVKNWYNNSIKKNKDFKALKKNFLVSFKQVKKFSPTAVA